MQAFKVFKGFVFFCFLSLIVSYRIPNPRATIWFSYIDKWKMTVHVSILDSMRDTVIVILVHSVQLFLAWYWSLFYLMLSVP